MDPEEAQELGLTEVAAIEAMQGQEVRLYCDVDGDFMVTIADNPGEGYEYMWLSGASAEALARAILGGVG
jgi:hypothetical protein